MKTTFTNIISTKRVKTADGRSNSVSEYKIIKLGDFRMKMH